MTIQSVLKEAYTKLFYAEVENPYLDSTVLLAETLGVSREKLFASLTDSIEEENISQYNNFLDMRCKGIPVSYIRQKKEFYGHEYYVDERVLVPRPDTETVVDHILSLCHEYKEINTVHDMCTGSGCIAVSLKLMLPSLVVSASDISPEAGEVFTINSLRLLNREIPFICSDLFNNINGRFDIIVANPPYLKDQEVDDMKKIGWPEPECSLRGGPAGTSVSQLIIREAPLYIEPGGFLILESSPENMESLQKTMEESGFTDISVKKDLGNRDRVITGRILWEK